MANYDNWRDGTANWDTPSDWSLGLPDASSDVVIFRGNPEVTASFGTVNSIRDIANLTFIDAGVSSVVGNVRVFGVFDLDPISGDGGSTLTIGKLNNEGGRVDIGPFDNTLSAPSTIEADKIANSYPGEIALDGSSTAQATLDVGSAAGFGKAGVLSGQVGLSGDALLEFAKGQITTIAAGSALTMSGSHAFVADASDTGSNSALTGLRKLEGDLTLNNGATVMTSGSLYTSGPGYTRQGSIALDQSSGDGGSLLNINGALMNSRITRIGPKGGGLSAESTLEAAKVVNDGAIDLHGGKAVDATLRCGGPFTNDGSVNLVHDTETIGGVVSGSGDFSLSTSTLEFVNGVSSGETVTFSGGVNHLYLDSPSSFSGTIDDFSTSGDSVIAKGFAEAQTTLAYTQISADSCSWTLTDATHTATLNFAGAPYAQSDFAISASANGNALIKFV
jgi:hypothetical protein